MKQQMKTPWQVQGGEREREEKRREKRERDTPVEEGKHIFVCLFPQHSFVKWVFLFCTWPHKFRNQPWLRIMVSQRWTQVTKVVKLKGSGQGYLLLKSKGRADQDPHSHTSSCCWTQQAPVTFSNAGSYFEKVEGCTTPHKMRFYSFNFPLIFYMTALL